VGSYVTSGRVPVPFRKSDPPIATCISLIWEKQKEAELEQRRIEVQAETENKRIEAENRARKLQNEREKREHEL